MKKLFFIFVAVACTTSSWGAVNVKTAGVKKAAPVATKQTDKMETATSLLPAVVGLVSNAKALSVQQQQLTADCAPTTSEIETVNNLVKEVGPRCENKDRKTYTSLPELDSLDR